MHTDNQTAMAADQKTKNEKLLRASQRGDLQAAQEALVEGADLNARYDNGMSALHLAAQSGHQNFIQYLLDKGVDLKTLTPHGMSVLHFAVMGGRINLIQHLLNVGFDLKVQSTTRGPFGTLLHLAANCKRLAILKWFAIELPTSVWKQIDKHGKTPIDLLSGADCLEFEQYLKPLVCKENNEKFLLFMLGRYKRTGADSAMQLLPDDVMGMIFNGVVYEDVTKQVSRPRSP